MKRLFLLLAALILVSLSLVGVNSAHAANPVPYPAALQSGHPWAGDTSPTGLFNWGPGSNAPGNCTNPNQGEIVNHTSYVQLSTSGATGDCNDLESPHQYPTNGGATTPTGGYVYETKIEVSNWGQWFSFWGYGSNWPVGGEIDTVEGGSGRNYVSYHYQGSGGPASVSNCNNTNGCNGNAGPITVPSNSFTLTNISPGVHIVDVAYGNCGTGCGAVTVYYDGNEVAQVSGSFVMNGGNHDDPFWLVFSNGSCNSANNGNVCGSGGQQGGWVKVYYLRTFT